MIIKAVIGGSARITPCTCAYEQGNRRWGERRAAGKSAYYDARALLGALTS